MEFIAAVLHQLASADPGALGLGMWSLFIIGMAWNDGVDRSTGYIVTATNWNDLIGASGSLMQLKSHAHGGTTGEGSQALGPLTTEDFTDAAAPAAPSAGRTRLYTVSGQPRYRANGGADRQIITDQSTAAGDLAGTYPSPTVAKITLGSDADGDIYYRASSVLARLAKGTANQVLAMNGGATAPTWVTAGGVTVFDRQLTTVTVNTTAAETDLYRKTVLANALGASGGLRLTFVGDFLNNTGGANSITFRIKFGATTLFTTGAVSIPVGATRMNWNGFWILFNATATNAQRAQAMWQRNISAGTGFFVVNTGTDNFMGYNTAAEDTTAHKDLAITAQPGTSSANLEARVLTVVTEQFA